MEDVEASSISRMLIKDADIFNIHYLSCVWRQLCVKTVQYEESWVWGQSGEKRVGCGESCVWESCVWRELGVTTVGYIYIYTTRVGCGDRCVWRQLGMKRVLFEESWVWRELCVKWVGYEESCVQRVVCEDSWVWRQLCVKTVGCEERWVWLHIMWYRDSSTWCIQGCCIDVFDIQIAESCVYDILMYR